MKSKAVSSLQWRGWKWVGVLLVPLLIAAAFLAGSWGAGSRTDKIKAAVVNNDQAVTINGQYTPLGRQLAAAMAGRDDANVTWILSDNAGAEAGLKSGEFAAVVTIPKNFSHAATSFANADQAEQATIDVRTSSSASVNDAAVAQQIASLATQTLNTQLTSTYLDNIYVGFNTMGQQFVTLAKAADQLSTGASGLASGASKASDGVTQLNTGMQQLAKGGTQLKTGLDQLGSAGPQLTSGGSQLTQNSSQLTSGASQLSSGASQLATGSQQLATGVKKYTEGASTLSQGADQYAAGVAQLKQQLAQNNGGSVSSQLSELTSGAGQVAKGADGVSQMAQGYQGSFAAMTSSDAIAQVTAQCTQGGGSAEYCAGLAAGYRSGVGTAQQTWTTIGLTGTAASVAKGASGLDAGLGKAVAGIDQAAAAQTKQLGTAVDQLNTGAQQLAGGAKQLASQGGALSSGAQQTAAGAKQLSGGASELSSGVSQYTQGVSTYVTGVNQYVAGVSKLSTGATGYIDGVNKVAASTPQLASGMQQLSSGASELAKGTGSFAAGLKQGKSSVPSYTEQQRKTLSTVVSAPVNDPSTGAVGQARIPLVIAVLAIGLWLGALALNLVRRPVPADALASTESTAKLYLRTMLPGAIFVAAEAGLLTAIGAAAIDLSFGRSMVLLGVLAVVGLAFVTINQALAAWFPTLGRVLSIVLATAAAAVSATAAIPGVFGAVHDFSPLKPALDGLRAVVSGESLVSPVGQLLTWSVAAIVLGTVAIGRSRAMSVGRFLHVTAPPANA